MTNQYNVGDTVEVLPRGANSCLVSGGHYVVAHVVSAADSGYHEECLSFQDCALSLGGLSCPVRHAELTKPAGLCGAWKISRFKLVASATGPTASKYKITFHMQQPWAPPESPPGILAVDNIKSYPIAPCDCPTAGPTGVYAIGCRFRGATDKNGRRHV